MTEPHSSPKPFDHLFVSQLNELFRWRRDVRRFQTRPIDESLLTELIYSCLNAPSVGNSQPWRFVVVKDQRARHAVSQPTSLAPTLPGTRDLRPPLAERSFN
mgnify:CR=1 FL=1